MASTKIQVPKNRRSWLAAGDKAVAAESWNKPRRVAAKVEFHAKEFSLALDSS